MTLGIAALAFPPGDPLSVRGILSPALTGPDTSAMNDAIETASVISGWVAAWSAASRSVGLAGSACECGAGDPAGGPVGAGRSFGFGPGIVGLGLFAVTTAMP